MTDCNSLLDEEQLLFFSYSGASDLFIPGYPPHLLIHREVEVANVFIFSRISWETEYSQQ